MKTRNHQTLFGMYLGLALICLLPLPGLAQNARLSLNNLDKLSDKATEVNDITLDGDLLQFAVKALEMSHDSDAAQVKDVIKGIKGIYVKNFEFDQPNQYSAADVAAIRSQLAAPGWMRIVESHNKRDPETDEIYALKSEEGKIAGLAILVAEPKELTVVNIVGFINLDKLGLLMGKFGIPSADEKNKLKNRSSEETSHDDE